MAREPRNVAASIRARLQDLAKEQQADFQRVLTRYALERLLFRLSVSPHKDLFVLKNASMVRFAIARALPESPPLYAGWPQQVWTAGTSTTHPASSSSLTAANPTAGRKRSTRQVTSSPTRGRAVASSGDCRALSDTMEAPPQGCRPILSDRVKSSARK